MLQYNTHLCIYIIIHYRSQKLNFRLNLFELRENKRISPKMFMSMVSNLLYEKRLVDILICTAVK